MGLLVRGLDSVDWALCEFLVSLVETEIIALLGVRMG